MCGFSCAPAHRLGHFTILPWVGEVEVRVRVYIIRPSRVKANYAVTPAISPNIYRFYMKMYTSADFIGRGLCSTLGAFISLLNNPH